MEERYAAHPEDVKHYDTTRLRQNFLVEQLMVPGEIKFVYSHYERFILGGVVPTSPMALPTYDALKADFFLERRELGIINVGNTGYVHVDSETYPLANKECLYIGMGAKDITFGSDDGTAPAHYYLCSSPAHATYPTTKYTLEDAEPMTIGTKEACNERTIYKFIHGGGIQSAQLVMGMTMFSPGCIWNTMPAHHHNRRNEAYFYFDLQGDAKVMHFMGQPDETRHLVVGNEEAIISPPWSVHFGAGTSSYSFIWAMAGENQDYTDMDAVPMNELK